MIIKATNALSGLWSNTSREWTCEDGCGRTSHNGILCHAFDCPGTRKLMAFASPLNVTSGGTVLGQFAGNAEWYPDRTPNE